MHVPNVALLIAGLLEEKSAEIAAELTDEAQRLHKSLDVLKLGEKVRLLFLNLKESTERVD